MPDRETSGQPGFAVDASGNPVVDPTKNVLDLVTAAIQRQDDLRAALEQRLDTKIDGNASLSEERHAHTRRELANVEERRVEHKKDTKDTVDTAFAGAEKAIAKSEAAASDKIKSVESTVSDLKDRVLRLETTATTRTEGRGEARSNVGMLVGIAGVAFGLLSLIIVYASFLSTQ